MFPDDLLTRATALLERCQSSGVRLATVESCTGGLLAGLLTSVAGSSAVFERGWVTYTNEAKAECVGVDAALLARHGAVSAEVAQAMAAGGLIHSPADLAVSITGIAGPGGATPVKPVGLVYLGLCRRGGIPAAQRHLFDGDRGAVRLASVATALALLEDSLRAGR